MYLLKKTGIILLSNILKFFWIFPLKEKTILFISFGGKQYSDSPKAIYEEILKCNNDFNLIWGFNTPENYNNISTCKKIKKPSLKYIYYFCTSKYIVDNTFIDTYLPVRKKQVLINTWHGGGWFKKVGLTDNNTTEYDKFYFDYQCRKYKYFLASSEYFVDTVLHPSFNYQGEILRIGMPRNAIFFQENSELRATIRSQFKADDNTMLVLYAPTFRSYPIESNLELDLHRLERCIADKFDKKVVILFRAHHLIDKFPIDYTSIINVTEYPDMQHLLLACDILVSDYSSCMWDAAIQDKLVIVYAPDAQHYIDNRGFFLDIREWPFLLAFNNKELDEVIQSYDRDVYVNKLHNLIEDSKSYECAGSAIAIRDLIMSN